MKTKTVFKKLGNLRTHTDNNGVFYFTSRFQDSHFVKVWIKDAQNCTALPIRVLPNGEEIVVFHPKTVKSLADFMRKAE